MKPKLLFFRLIIFLFSQILLSQNIEWQRSLGGKYSEYLFSSVSTPDNGYLMAGSSLSEEQNTDIKSSLNYYLYKMNEQGFEEWHKTFGGKGNDFLYSIALTKDGGYILGGSSDSGISGTKKDSCRGSEDYWIIKLNAEGEEEWQKTIGGSGMDKLLSIEQTSDLGYIIGGSSDSGISGDKTENGRGNMDYWIVKTDKTGKLQWQKTLGGRYFDLLRSIKETKDGYILAGYSNSPKSEDKEQDNIGIGDYWLVKLDKNGNKIWEKTIGGDKDDQLYSMEITNDGGYILAGSSNSSRSNAKEKENANNKSTDIWLIKTDEFGESQWQQTLSIGEINLVTKIIQNKDGSYLIAGNSLIQKYNKKTSENKTQSDYTAIKISEKGEVLWKKTYGGDGADVLQSVIETRDGGYVLSGTSDSKAEGDKTEESKGLNDFWILKLKDTDKEEVIRKNVEVYPNPTERYVNVVLGEELNPQHNNEIQVIDNNGALLQRIKIKQQTTPIDLGGYQVGVYYLQIIFNNKKETSKIIKNTSF